MSRTYEFIVELARAHVPAPAALLDFGCGNGEAVRRALAAGYDAHGADRFDGVWAQYRDAAHALGPRMHLMPSPGELPFPDARFDIAVSNQVFEHIAQKRQTVTELARVLRPGGLLIAIFPTRDIIVEPHLRAPLVHRLAQGSRIQRLALHVCHLLGCCSAPGADRRDWVADAMHCLTTDISYLSDRDVPGVFAPAFSLRSRAEPAFMRDRLEASPRLRRIARLAAPSWLDGVLRVLCLSLANGVYIFERTECTVTSGPSGPDRVGYAPEF